MNEKVTKTGIAIAMLEKTFSGRAFDPKVCDECWHDLDETAFMKAVFHTCKTLKQAYQGTNLIAIIREKALEEQLKMRREVNGHIEYKWPDEKESKKFLEKLKQSIIKKTEE
jgi:predicted membrane-bound dolichyl-phosphate-mannose-protein mannosyltransferase